MQQKYFANACFHGQCYTDETMAVKVTCEQCLSVGCPLHAEYGVIMLDEARPVPQVCKDQQAAKQISYLG